MTKAEKTMLAAVKTAAGQAEIEMAKAEENLRLAAEACKGTPMEAQLLSIYDELIDLKLDTRKQVKTFEERLNGYGNEAPESWRDAG